MNIFFFFWNFIICFNYMKSGKSFWWWWVSKYAILGGSCYQQVGNSYQILRIFLIGFVIKGVLVIRTPYLHFTTQWFYHEAFKLMLYDKKIIGKARFTYSYAVNIVLLFLSNRVFQLFLFLMAPVVDCLECLPPM